MIPRLAVAALLGLVLSTLGALANASPPDPGWIGGFYDAADDDDVILAVTGMDQASGLEPPLDVGCLYRVGVEPVCWGCRYNAWRDDLYCDRVFLGPELEWRL